MLHVIYKRDFFLDKQREKAKLEAEMKLMVTLHQLIPAGEAKPIAPLGVILSQYYLNLTDFCKDFNSKTQQWEEGVLLPIKVKKGLRAKEYKMAIYTPSFSFLLDNGFPAGKLRATVLFDIVRIKAQLTDYSLRRTACLLFPVIHSFNYKKIYYR